MPQTADIVLNGDSYMLGSSKGREPYTRSQDGMDEGRTGRIQQTDFFGGTRRPFQLENDRGWESTTIGPTHGGQGVTPWPYTEQVALVGTTPLATAADPFPYVVINAKLFFAVGRYLYEAVAITAATWTTPVQRYDAGAGNVITGLCPYLGSEIIICRGSTADIVGMLTTTYTVATVTPGKRANKIVPYMGQFLASDVGSPGGYPNRLWLYLNGAWEERFTDTEILNLANAQAEVIAATRNAVYSFSGSFGLKSVPNNPPPPEMVEVVRWTGELNPYFQHGTAAYADDYAFITGFGGRTYAWIGHMVMEHDPNGDRAGWRDIGLSGVKCYGACVAAGYLVVSIISEDNKSELWAWDGSGWWCIHSEPVTAGFELLAPIPLAGAGGFDVGVFRNGTRDLKMLRLVYRSTTAHTYPVNGSYTTSLIDLGERDKQKAWRKIGCVFGSPDLHGNPASLDMVACYIEFSADGGLTWFLTSYTERIGNTLPNNNFTLESALGSAAAVSNFLMLRVTWNGVVDWAPILVGIWAEYELLDSPARRRRWQFTVTAQDQVIDRDGATLTRTGRQQIGELWDHWQAGTTVPFRDIDYDADPTERYVRIVGIKETVPVPHQAGKWGQSAVALTLVEV